MSLEQDTNSDNLVKDTIKGDEEYYAQEDIIWRSVRGVGEMFRHLVNPHFKSIWTFLFAYLFNMCLLGQALIAFVLVYYYFFNLKTSDLSDLPIILFVLLEAFFVLVISVKITLGMNKFLMKTNALLSLVFLLSIILIVILLMMSSVGIIFSLPTNIY